MGSQKQRILQIDLRRHFQTVPHHSPGASYPAGQEEEEETDGRSERERSWGGVSFKKEGYFRENELSLKGLEGRKRRGEG